jgi:4-oxalomesaconate tautomerase
MKRNDRAAQLAIPAMLMRGGTSRGAYFAAADVPKAVEQRDRLLVAVMGGPDVLQVDGIGGGHPLTSKVAIVGPSEDPTADVDYLFLQVVPSESRVDTTQNCGNILAGVGPFAIESGWVSAGSVETRIRVRMVNSGSFCILTVQTPQGRVSYEGDAAIDGVPGTAAPIVCEFLDVAGSACGALLPTGSRSDAIQGALVTCIDNGMPVVLLRAEDLGCRGDEPPEILDADEALKARLEKIRLELGPRMNLGDVEHKTVPKMCLISRPRGSGHVSTRTFIPHVCHRAIGVLGAVSVATACVLPGTIADGVARVPPGELKTLEVEHPTGSFQVRLLVRGETVEQAGVIRTARPLFRGEVLVSASRLASG